MRAACPPLSTCTVAVPAVEPLKFTEPPLLTSMVALPPLDDPRKFSNAPLTVMFDEPAVEVPTNWTVLVLPFKLITADAAEVLVAKKRLPELVIVVTPYLVKPINATAVKLTHASR